MKKFTVLALVLTVLLPLGTNAATITFGTVTTYADGTPIPADRIPMVTYRAWYTSSPDTGPWTAGNTTKGTELVAPDPAAGATGWYSVSAFIAGVEGSESVRCAPASKKMPPLEVSSPAGCSVR